MFEVISEFRENANELLHDCGSFAQSQGMDETAQMILRAGEQCAEDRYQIAIIGFMKRGKSTLLNVLLGREDTALAPVRSTICTSVITKYIDASLMPEKMGKASVIFLNGEAREIRHDELDNFINQKKNHENEKGVKFIEVYGNFPLIRSSVAIVDTPGRGSVHREHDILSDEFLPFADAIILVQAADIAMEADERRFLSNLQDKEKHRIFVVVTKSDVVNEKGLSDSVTFIRSQLGEVGIQCNKIYQTAAQKVLEAHKAGEEASILSGLREKWGIIELEKDLQEEIYQSSERTDWIKRRFTDALTVIESFLSAETTRLKNALSKFSSNIRDLESEQQRILQTRKDFQQEYEKKKEVFYRSWNYEVHRFLRKMEPIKQRIGDRLQRDLENKGLVSLWSHSTKLPRYVKEVLAAEFQESLFDLEKHLNTLLEEFKDVFDEAIEITLPFTKSNITGFSSGLVASLGIAGSSMAIGGGVALNTIGSVTASLTSASVAAETASASTAIWSSWFGTQSAVNAATGAAAFKASVFGTAFSTLGALCGIGVGVFLATKIATSLARGSQGDKILKILDEYFEEFEKMLTVRIDASSRDIADALMEQANEQMSSYEVLLDSIAKALQENDPSIKQGIINDLQKLQELSERYVHLKNSLSAISIH